MGCGVMDKQLKTDISRIKIVVNNTDEFTAITLRPRGSQKNIEKKQNKFQNDIKSLQQSKAQSSNQNMLEFNECRIQLNKINPAMRCSSVQENKNSLTSNISYKKMNNRIKQILQENDVEHGKSSQDDDYINKSLGLNYKTSQSKKSFDSDGKIQISQQSFESAASSRIVFSNIIKASKIHDNADNSYRSINSIESK